MRTSIRHLLLVFCGLLALSCAASTDRPSTTVLPSGLNPADFDPGVRPQDNLYKHVNGRWLKRTEIPADRSNYGSFTVLADDADKNVRAIIEEMSAGQGATTGDGQKVGDFYKSYLDEKAAESLGVAPLKELLATIDGLADRPAVASFMGHAQTLGVAMPLVFYVDQDSRAPQTYSVYLTQSGLGLPDKDLYSKDDEPSKALRQGYLDYLASLFRHAGLAVDKGQADALAEKIMKLETHLAAVQWTRVQNRDRDKTYNKVSRDALITLAKFFPVDNLLQAGLVPAAQQEFIVSQPTYLQAYDKIFADTSLDAWKAYLRARVLDAFAPYLSAAFVDAHFGYHGRIVSGTEENLPRWKRAVEEANDVLGEVIGKLYVKKHFDAKAKHRMGILIENLRRAFAVSIKELSWMGDETKKRALEKLSKFTMKIGYPDKWRDYSALTIQADDLFGNIQRAALFVHKREMAKLGGPVDRHEWFMNPQTVNAYYNASMNEIVFPAAILQPPFFDPNADDAVNYGAIVAVIGHEFSHGFDDQGRKSDGDGLLRDWWTEKDAAEFKKRADGLVAQYNEFSPLPGEHVNGALTLGENIGDLAGLTMAFRAYQMSLDGKPAPVIDGMTGAQRFFFGWAQIWRRKYRDSELRRRLLTDPHSPSAYRVQGVVQNMPAFYEAFSLKSGDKLYLKPEARVQIW